MFEVVPAILEKDWVEIEKKLEALKGISKTVHIDIIDGKFVNTLTFLDPTPFAKYKDDFILGAHFIVEEPINYLDSFYKAGFKTFIGQIEKMNSQEEFVAKGELLGEVGLAIDQDTELDRIKVDLFDLDLLTIMTVKVGASGQLFNEQYLEKVRELRKRLQEEPIGKKLTIEVDGGINDQTIVQAKEAGADRFISNSYIFSGKVSENLKKLNQLLGR